MFFFLFSYNSEAEKAAQVSKIQFDQKIMEKESLKKMSEIEGELLCLCFFVCFQENKFVFVKIVPEVLVLYIWSHDCTVQF